MQQRKNTKSPVTVVILAGGTSRRMGGVDKGLLTLRGQPLVAHVVQRLAPQADTLLINCNENQQDYVQFGYPLVRDGISGGLGPLAGLLGAMQSNDNEYVLSVPCDTPYLPHDLVARMLHTLQHDNADLCSVHDGERLHPVILLARRHLAPSLEQFLNAGQRKVRDWYDSQHHCTTDFSDQPLAFANINTPEELQAAEHAMGQ